MLDLSFIYPFQSDRLIFHWNKPLPLRENLKFQAVRDGYALPVERKGRSSRWMGYGGIADSSKRFVPASAMLGENGKQSMGLTYTFDSNTCPKLQGEYIYLGFFIKHWGHFIIDSSTRLYFAIANPDIKCFFILRRGQNPDPFPAQIERALELAGLRQRIIFINQPTHIENIIVPDQAYVSQTYYSQEYINTFNAMINCIKPSQIAPAEKIFFSRTKFNEFRKCEIGGELIDKLFANDGYTIINPEFESLDNQIFYLNSCKKWGAVAGSLIHNLMFSLTPPETKIVNKSSYINLEDMDTCKIKGVTPQYLDFYVSRLPTHHYWGPFMFFPNENMINYINSKMLANKCADLLDLESHKGLFHDFKITYDRLWPNQHVNIEADAEKLARNYFHPDLVLNWEKNFNKLEHD